MADNEPETAPDDEVILSAQCSGGWSWFGAAFGTLITCGLAYGIYVFPLREDYFRFVGAVIALPVWIVLTVEILFTKEIVFYRDRVEKVWYLLGRRTIPYSSEVVRGPVPGRWHLGGWLVKPKGYGITEVGTDGKAAILQIPIWYNARFVDRHTAKQIDAIMVYMAGEDLSKPTRFAKYTLSRETLCQSQA